MHDIKIDGLLNALDDPAMVLDLDNRIIAVNDKTKELTNLPGRSLLGSFCHEIFHKQAFPPAQCPHGSLLQHGKTITCTIEKERFGKMFEVTVSPILDDIGQTEAVLHVAHDVTGEHRTRSALRQSEKKYRTLLDITMEGFWLLNTDLEIVEVNNALCTMLGYSEEELLGKTPYDLVDEKNRNIFLAQCSRVSVSQHRRYEVTLRRKDGAPVHVLINATTITGEKGDLEGSFCFLTDISETKRLEEELAQSRKMEALGTLAGGIAHDFNNILAAILGFSEIVKLELPEGSRSAKDIEKVIVAGKRAAELVKQILSFSRKNARKKMPVRMDRAVHEALQLARATLPATVQVQSDFTLKQSVILADPSSIHQIVLNLCTNAMHAMKDEKGEIIIGMDRVRLSREEIGKRPGVSPGRFVVLSVRDNGAGMDEKTLKRIFEPYFTTKGKGRGTGLGLAMIHGIVERCKGFIEVESEKDKGSLFRLYFPEMLHEGNVEEVRENDRPLATGTERILVVDDEPSITELLRTILTHLGYGVVARTSSRVALEKFIADPDAFDLVLTDQTMPDLTGMELAAKILAIRPEIPVLLITGYSAVLSEEETRAIGIRRFIAKPISTRVIAATIREVLDEKVPDDLL